MIFPASETSIYKGCSMAMLNNQILTKTSDLSCEAHEQKRENGCWIYVLAY
jgi:hypothetical protein